MKRSLLSLVVVPLAFLGACGSDDQAAPPTEPAETSAPSDTVAPSSAPSTTDAAPATEAPAQTLRAEPVDCVIPAELAGDSSGQPYALSEPTCVGGWMFAYPTDCEMECEGAFAFESVDDEWEARGSFYNVCFEPAVEQGIPEAIALYYIRASCESEGDELFLIADEPTTGPLSIGDVGPRVAAMDEALRASGFLAEAPNDRFDYETLKAVLDLQFQLELEVDGYAGPMTLGALGLA